MCLSRSKIGLAQHTAPSYSTTGQWPTKTVLSNRGAFSRNASNFSSPGRSAAVMRETSGRRQPAVDENVFFGFDERGQAAQKSRFDR